MLPPFLNPGDRIHIVSPSGNIDPSYVDGARNLLESWGYKVTEGDFTRSEYGRFAGNKEQRTQDLQVAFDNTEIKAVLCSRGGYGLAQIVDRLDLTGFIKSPKWLFGFSDITILHNIINNAGIASVHSVMAKHLTTIDADMKPVELFKNILEGNLPEYSVASHPMNRNGKADGKLIGGNLSVFVGLRSTPFDLNYKGNILFIEDVDEQPYHIDRMMQNLRLGGVFSEISGLLVGQFSECEEDPRMKQTINEIILDAVKDYNFPVCFNFPAGHVDENMPLILGCNTLIELTPDSSNLRFSPD